MSTEGARVRPEQLAPMLALAGSLPSADDGWAFEPKWDGMRALVHLEGGVVAVRSRNRRDVTASFPELAALGPVLDDAVLDGELVTLDEAGRSSFQRLQERMHRSRPSSRLVEEVPVVFVAFDVLWLAGSSLLDRPFSERRAVLSELRFAGASWQTGPSFTGAGAEILESALALGFEGVVAKRLSSTYQPGRRSRDWIKVKVLERCEFVVGGWVPGEGGRSGTVGSLLLGAFDEGGALRFVGSAGSGLSERDLAFFSERLGESERPDSPFADPVDRRPVRFCEPQLVVEVEFRQITAGGSLRQPTYKGLRPDKDPKDVTFPDTC